MLRHSDIWRAIDAIAAKYGYTASGLARRAGLDPTTFNKSKRITPEGKTRWPSTESVAKVLYATGASLAEFVSYADSNGTAFGQRVPVIGIGLAGLDGVFDDAGYPDKEGWDEVTFPDLADPHAYALEITDSGFEPVYRDGDIIVAAPTSGVRRGDRVVVRTKAGEVVIGQLRRQSARKLELHDLGRQHGDRTLDADEVAWVHRIIWASQ